MQDWGYAQRDPGEQLARVHHFSMCKIEPDREIEMTITVKEFFTPKDPALLFFAEADKQTNQKVAPYHSLRLGQDAARSPGRMRPGGQPVSVSGIRSKGATLMSLHHDSRSRPPGLSRSHPRHLAGTSLR